MTLPHPDLYLDAGPAGGGVPVPVDTSPPTTGTATAPLRLTWGRRTVRDLIDPTTLSFEFLDYGTGSWTRDHLHVGRVVIIPNVFSGRITDVVTRPKLGHGMLATVTATDDSAEWANTYIGSTPWPAELAYDRVVNIRDAAGLTGDIIWPGSTTTEEQEFNPMVYPRDVDRRTARELLDSIATTIDCAVAVGGGNRLVFHQNGWAPQPEPPPDITISVDQVEMHGEYAQTVADLATRAAVGWWAGDPPQQRTYYHEPASDYGVRNISVRTERWSSQIIPPSGVTQLGAKLIGRMGLPTWRLPSLRTRETLMADDEAMSALLAAIRRYTNDGETLLLLRDVPASFPVPWSNQDFPGDLYIRLLGGTYVHDGKQWHVELHGVRAPRSSFG